MHITQQLQTLYETILIYLTILNTKQAVTLGVVRRGSEEAVGESAQERKEKQGEPDTKSMKISRISG